MFFKKKYILIAFVIGLAYLIFGTLNLKYYGANWDEPVHFGRGQAILNYFLTGNKDFNSFTSERKSYYQSDSYTYEYFEKQFANRQEGKLLIGGGHPPLSDIFASAFNLVFFQKLNLIGDIESYHFYSVFLAAILVSLVFLFTTNYYGVFSGIIASISLGLYPLFIGESRYNIKDIPEAVFFSLAIFFFYKGIKNNSIKWIIFSSIATGFAFGTKLNIVFLPLIIFPWFFIYYFNEIRNNFFKFVKKRSKILASFAIYPIASFVIFFAFWPMLWEDTFARFITIINYYKEIGINPDFDSRFITFFRINTYPTQWILYTTPLVILFLSIVGVIYTIKNGFKEKHKFSLLVLFWFLVPILRVTMPNAGIYGGVRQIMEYIPAMAILSGIGAYFCIQTLNSYSKKIKIIKSLRYILVLVILLSFIPFLIKLIEIHPNESVYFNEIIGGLRGAKEKDIPGWGNSLGSTYRQGVEWINNNAEDNAKLVLGYELRSNISDIDLRSDIKFDNQLRSGTKREGEYAISVTHDNSFEHFYYKKYLERFLNPIYEITVDDIPILKIWKNDLEYTKPEYRGQEEKNTDLRYLYEDNNIVIDMGKVIKLTKIDILYNYNNCSVPKNGYFQVSKDKKTWTQIEGDFSLFQFAAWFNTMPKEGILTYLFAADEARYIRMIINDSNSCLLAYPIKATALHIPLE